MSSNVTCGVDIGARSIKVLLFDSSRGGALDCALSDTGHRPAASAREMWAGLLKRHGLDESATRTVATGYGRESAGFACHTVTEIRCHARGVSHSVPDVRTILDVGGQDSKVIVLDGAGGVVDFAMNDRCAAGTGRFFEVMAGILELTPDEMANAGRDAVDPVIISNTCVVFAESEVVGMLARGVARPDIIAGIDRAAARRLAALGGRLPMAEPAVFTGGVALNHGVVSATREATGLHWRVCSRPRFAGALGAALEAADRL